MTAPTCITCGKPATRRCRWPVGTTQRTCDQPVCAEHGVTVDRGLVYCPGHAAQLEPFGSEPRRSGVTVQVHTAVRAPDQVVVRICREADARCDQKIVWYRAPYTPGGWLLRHTYRGWPPPAELIQQPDTIARGVLDLIGYKAGPIARIGGREIPV